MGGMGCKVCYDTPCTCPKPFDDEEFAELQASVLRSQSNIVTRLLATAESEREKLAEVCALIRKIRGNSYPVSGISGTMRMSVNKDWLFELGQLIGDEK